METNRKSPNYGYGITMDLIVTRQMSLVLSAKVSTSLSRNEQLCKP